MSVKEFDKVFGLSSSIEEEKTKFINRIENKIFDWFISNYEFGQYQELFEQVCYHLGLDSQEFISQYGFNRTSIPNFKTLLKKDFIQTLRITVAVYKETSDRPDVQEFISAIIVDSLEKANLNLGIKWVDGVFYPTGDKFWTRNLLTLPLLFWMIIQMKRLI